MGFIRNIKRYIVCLIITLCMIFLTYEDSFAAPNIENIESKEGFHSNNKIMIRGTDFGPAGPNIVMFDDFDGEDAALLDKQGAIIGEWDDYHDGTPQLMSDSDGNVAYLGIDDGTNRIGTEFEEADQVFVSYRVKIPEGYCFPNAFESGSLETDQASVWKLVWVLQDRMSGVSGDGSEMCVPSVVSGQFAYKSNIGAPWKEDSSGWFRVGRTRGDTRWFTLSGWNRFSGYLELGYPSRIEDYGYMWGQGLSEEFGQVTNEAEDYYVTTRDTGYAYMTVPGWYRGSPDCHNRALYDDIYIATGPYARARVEIGNNSVYEDCSRLAILTIDSWANNEITATARMSWFSEGENAYLFVVDSDGNPSEGYPIVIGDSNDSEGTLSPPEYLQITKN